MNLVKKTLTILLCAAMVLTYMPMSMLTAYAAAGDTPDAEKSITDNGDGTYTLSLDIVGESEVDTENTKANIVVILDRSGSMRYYVESDTGRYGSTNDNPPSQNNVYGNNRATLYSDTNGTEVTDNTTPGPVYTRAWQYNRYVYTEYTGKRYADELRMAVAKEAVNDLVTEMQKYNAQVPNTVQMALVSFSDRATTNVGMTGTLANITNAINATGQSAINPEGGTNWEEALQTARTIANNADDDPTYVIFVTDGNPTRYGTGQGSGQETTDNINTSYNAARDDARAIVNDGFTLYNLGVFGSVDRMGNLTTYANGATSADKGEASYYSVANKEELQEAFAEIIDQISENIGISEVDITDGTTSMVTTSSGVAHLLEVVPNSFKYYRSGGDYGNMKEWTSADDPAPPAAVFNPATGQVEWDLSSLDVLENEVKYTVTFEVYPSQETYDLIAQLKNGDIKYADVDPEIQKYISDGSYSLRTNTTASYSWVDTREENPEEHSENYTNPDPVATSSDTLPIKKEWEGGNPDVSSVDITVLMDEGTEDEEAFHTATLTASNNWETSSYISVGIIKDGAPLPGAMGHDFSFAELDGSQYHWEIDAPVVRPMLINGGGAAHTPTMLIKVDSKHPAPEGAQTYTIDGSKYYVDSATSGLKATNHRRSNLNLTKVVTGEDAPKDAKFPFQLTVNNSLKPEAAPSASEDPDHESDWWVWLSIRDEKGQGVTGLNLGSGVVEDSGGYYYAPSGTTFNVEIGAGWSLRFLNLPSGSTYTFAEGDLDEGWVFTSSELTSGEDSTFVGNKTTTGTIENTKTSYAVKYSNDYALTDLEITKVWNDANNQDGLRPKTVEDFASLLTLSPSVEGKTPTVVDNGDNTYTITYTGLPRYEGEGEDKEEVEYTVTESAIEGYETTGSPAKDHGTITNKHEPEVTEATVTKVWNDSEDQDGKRPESISVQLKADGTDKGDPIELSADSETPWSFTWTTLPKYENGKEIEYTWAEDETGLPEGYTLTSNTTQGTVTTITNSYTPEVTSITVTKAWVDNSDQDGFRPEELELTLNANGEPAADAPDPTITKSGNNWTYTWTGLDKYKDGEEIEYTVTEDAVPERYEVSGSPAQPNGTITNTHTPETISVTVTKAWADNSDQDGIRPEELELTLNANGEPAADAPTPTIAKDGNNWTYTWTGLDKYKDGEEITYTVTEDAVPEGYEVSGSPAQPNGTITNTHTPEKISVTVTKAWADNSDQDGIRPEELALTLKADGTAVTGATPTIAKDGNNWTYTWSNLDKFKDGEEITYTVSEDSVPEGYEVSGSPAQPNGTITNTHETEKISITVTKAWADNSDQDGIRPEELELTLKADGTAVTGVTPTIAKNGNSWTYTWSDLDKFKDGEEITYTVTEDSVPEGYEVSGSPAQPNGTITNTHTPEKISVTVTKAWADNSDQDGFRPDELELTLKADGTAVTGATPTIAKDGNNWTYTWSDLDKFKDGEEITYTVTEDSVPEGYEVSGSPAQPNGTITNTHTPEETEITVTKTWVDNNDQDGFRPEELVLTLNANGEPAADAPDPTIAKSGNNWTYTWSGLPKRADGQVITYTVTEDTVPEGYEVSGSPASNNGTITNTHTPDETSITVTKAWADNSDQDGIRPEELVLTLNANGEPAADAPDPTIAKSGNSWTYTWSGLPMRAGGQEITYTVTEDTVPEGYTMTGSPASNNGTITNTHTPEQTEASVKKVWQNDTESNRPESLTVKLLADGEETDVTKTLNAGNSWSATETGLDKYKDGGVPIEYTWEETDLPEYYSMVSNVTKDTETTITNKRFDSVDVTLNGTKTLEGRKLKDGEFTFILTEPDGSTQTTTNKSGKFSFGPFTFDTPGTYTYTIVEDNENLPERVVDNSQSFTATVEVTLGTGENDGKLVATVSGLEPEKWSADFVNIYEPSPTSATIVGEKILKGDRELKADEFSFTITGEYEPLEESKETEEEAAPEAEKKAAVDDTADENKEEAVEEKADKAAEEAAEKATEEAAEAKAEAEEAKAEAAEANADAEKADAAVEEAKKALEAADEAGAEAAKAEVEKAEAAAEEAKADAAEADAKAEKAEAAADAAEAKAEAAGEASGAEAPAAEPEGEAEPSAEATAVEEAAEAVVKAADIEVPMPAETTVKNDDKGIVDFGKIEFSAEGTYTYTITEDTDNLPPGVECNTDSQTVVIVVKYDDDKGEYYVASITPESAPRFTFTNTYTPVPGVSSITINKDFVGHDMKEGDFTFVLKNSDGEVVKTAKNTAEGTASFEDITFKKAGTYEFTITETKGGSPVITYDGSVYTVKATVTDNFDGQPMTVTWTDAEGITFVNTYFSEVWIDPPVTKVVKGTPKTTETYTFLLEAEDPENPMPEEAGGESSMTLDITGAGTKEFGKIVYTEPGEYSYTVTEVAGDNPDCEYDGSVYRVTAIVTEDPDTYMLNVETVYEKDGEEVNTAVFKFTNTYEEETPPPDEPDTGDTNNPFAALAVFLLAGAGLGGTYAYKRRKEDE